MKTYTRLHSFPFLAAVVLISAVPASAASFQWEDLTTAAASTSPSGTFPDGTYFRTTSGGADLTSAANGVFGGSLSYTNAGITVVARAFFDAGAGAGREVGTVVHDAGEAGLGVYSKRTSGGQFVNSDDNITGGTGQNLETLQLDFLQGVTLTSLVFRDADHNKLNAGMYQLKIDGAAPLTLSFADAFSYTGQVFEFTYVNTQFYVSAATASSVPDGGSSAVLLGISVLGLGASRRFLKRR